MSNVEKSLSKFKLNLEKGSVYEAQQFIKTVYHRLRSRKSLEDSRVLLKSAACLQYQHNEVTCGTELSTLLLEAYRTDKLSADRIAIDGVLEILDALESSSYSPDDYNTVAKAALKWIHSSGGEESAQAAPRVHGKLGKYLSKTQEPKRMYAACAHLARSEDMQSLAKVLVEASEDFAEGESELLATKSVLQVLVIPHRKPEHLVSLADQLNCDPTFRKILPKDSVLGHFISYLLQALSKRSLHIVWLLRREYWPSLSKDPSLDNDLKLVEAVHLGQKPPGSGLEGLFGNMFGALMG